MDSKALEAARERLKDPEFDHHHRHGERLQAELVSKAGSTMFTAEYVERLEADIAARDERNEDLYADLAQAHAELNAANATIARLEEQIKTLRSQVLCWKE